MDEYTNQPGGCPGCNLDTGGNHAWNCPNNPYRYVSSLKSTGIGWECPRCKTVWSPDIKQCNCRMIVIDGITLFMTQASAG